MQLQIFVAVTLMISLPAQMRAQENLVPNPGFEVINECPNHFSLISAPDEPFTYCDSWLEPNKGSSDIYHACCTWPYTVSVPDNVIGHIPAARGNAYGGIYMFYFYDLDPGQWLYREYLQVKLKEPLVAGKSYCIGFLTRPLRHNATDSSSVIYVVQDIGVHISQEPVRDFGDWTGLQNLQVEPQIVADNVVDVTDWTRISGIYLAEGGEQWITLGNFQDDEHSFPREIIETPVAPTQYPSWGVPHYAYYFIDEVFVIAIDEYWAFGQQYWKMCSEGMQLPLTARPGLDYYHWSTGDTTQQVTFPSEGIYTIDASYLGCPFRDTVLVEAFAPPVVNLGPDINICVNGMETGVTLKNSSPLEDFFWSNNSTSPEIFVAQAGRYTLATEHICGYFADTIELTGCRVDVYIPNVITPESNDINSIFTPSGANVRFTLLEVYDYWGHLLYRTEQPELGWDGSFRGNLVPPGVYMWRLRYVNETDHKETEKIGNVTVIR